MSLILLWIFSRDTVFLAINGANHPAIDSLMKAWTLLGDGWTAAGIALAFLLVRFRVAFCLGIASISSSLIVQLLKRLVFEERPRPLRYFSSHGVDIHLPADLKIHMAHSFPSGHTAAAFAVFFCLAFFARTTSQKFLLFTLALGVGYSRIYLAQHFPEDVLAGALIGVLCSFLAFSLSSRWKKNWLDKGFLIFRKQV